MMDDTVGFGMDVFVLFLLILLDILTNFTQT